MNEMEREVWDDTLGPTSSPFDDQALNARVRASSEVDIVIDAWKLRYRHRRMKCFSVRPSQPPTVASGGGGMAHSLGVQRYVTFHAFNVGERAFDGFSVASSRRYESPLGASFVERSMAHAPSHVDGSAAVVEPTG